LGLTKKHLLAKTKNFPWTLKNCLSPAAPSLKSSDPIVSPKRKIFPQQKLPLYGKKVFKSPAPQKIKNPEVPKRLQGHKSPSSKA
jgi:hypothetical protein